MAPLCAESLSCVILLHRLSLTRFYLVLTDLSHRDSTLRSLPCVILLGRLDRPVRATRQLYRVCVLVFFVFLRVLAHSFVNP